MERVSWLTADQKHILNEHPMLIIDRQDVDICSVPAVGGSGEVLQLIYQQENYAFIQAFSSENLTTATNQYQKLIVNSGDLLLLIREDEYYSLWRAELDRTAPSFIPVKITGSQRSGLWLVQELWLRLEDLVGPNQVRTIGEDILKTVSKLQSWEEIERLLSIDPLTTIELAELTDRDLEIIVNLLYSCTQRKLGQQFTTEMVEAILLDLPPEIRSGVTEILPKIRLD
jgi:hypothetical protein